MGKGPAAPGAVTDQNFVGVGPKPGPDRSGEGPLSQNNLAEGGRQLGRSSLRVAQGAGAGAVALPTLKAVGSYAGPDISRRFHNFRANTAAQTAANFAPGRASVEAEIRGLTARKALASPRANQVLLDAAKKLGPADLATLNSRLAANGNFIDMAGRRTDPFLGKLYGQVQKDMLAARQAKIPTLDYYKANIAQARAAESAARAKALAAAGRTPTPLAATRAGFGGKTNILGLGKLRNPVLGALMGGGYQAQKEVRNGPDE